MEKTYEVGFKVTIKKNKDIFEVTVFDGDVKSVMPARSLDEAMQVAFSSASGFAQFLLSQQVK